MPLGTRVTRDINKSYVCMYCKAYWPMLKMSALESFSGGNLTLVYSFDSKLLCTERFKNEEKRKCREWTV